MFFGDWFIPLPYSSKWMQMVYSDLVCFQSPCHQTTPIKLYNIYIYNTMFIILYIYMYVNISIIQYIFCPVLATTTRLGPGQAFHPEAPPWGGKDQACAEFHPPGATGDWGPLRWPPGRNGRWSGRWFDVWVGYLGTIEPWMIKSHRKSMYIFYHRTMEIYIG